MEKVGKREFKRKDIFIRNQALTLEQAAKRLFYKNGVQTEKIQVKSNSKTLAIRGVARFHNVTYRVRVKEFRVSEIGTYLSTHKGGKI